MGQWRVWQDAGIEVLSPGRILEIGFGTGHLLQEMNRRGYASFGLDPSAEMISLVKRRLKDDDPQPPLIRSKAQNIPIMKEQFDFVLSTFPSDYFLQSQALKEIYRVLRKGGQFVLIPGVVEITESHRGVKSLTHYLDRFASWLYHLTGEKSEPDSSWKDHVLGQFSELGFSPRIEYVRQPRGIILRIIATKP
jgi:ubiquinone/menaquinone biosynthesis C-methylase UbiE